jgi:hypothetical protein
MPHDGDALQVDPAKQRIAAPSVRGLSPIDPAQQLRDRCFVRARRRRSRW